MPQKRISADERRQADYDAATRQWAIFRPKLEAADNLEAAYVPVAEAPGQGRPGRQFYSNLGFFLQAFAVPNGLNAAGTLKPGALAAIQEAFRQAGSGRVTF